MDIFRRAALVAFVMLCGSGVVSEPVSMAGAQAPDAQQSDANGEVRRFLVELTRAVQVLADAIIDANEELARAKLEDAEDERREATRAREEAEREAMSATQAREVAQAETARARAQADTARAQAGADRRVALAERSAPFAGPIASLEDYWAALEHVVTIVETTPCGTMNQQLIDRYNRAMETLDQANQWGLQASRSDPTVRQRVESDPRNARLIARIQRAGC